MIFVDNNTYDDDDDALKQYFTAVKESLLM